MPEQPAPGALIGDAAARLADFARTCKAAARAVSLYPAGHPAIRASLARLSQVTASLTRTGPYRLQVAGRQLLPEGPAAAAGQPPDPRSHAPRPDPAVAELAALLHRHCIGRLTVNPGADADSWRALLLLLARPPEDVRADGGIRHLWTTAGGPSLELEEVDYAEVLRETQGLAAAVDQIVAAALSGARLELDDSGMRLLLDLVQDPARIDELLSQIDEATAGNGAEAQAAAFLTLVRGLTDWLARTGPGGVDAMLGHMGRAAGRLSAEAMLALLDQRRRDGAAPGGTPTLPGAVLDRMTDDAVSQFVASSVIRERGATERLAQAFQALVPDGGRQRRLVGLAGQTVAAAEGDARGFAELWQRVETMLLSYSDEHYVSGEYARELSSARTRALDVEETGDDPPERVAAWLATVADAVLRGLDQQLLIDLLHLEADARRWRDIAETAAAHADDLVRVGYFDQAWTLADAIAAEGSREAARKPYASAALERFGRGAMMKHVPAHLRGADEAGFARFSALCHAIGPAIIPALAEVLSSEQDARSRRRLRDTLVGFGADGREAVRRLMNAPNWEVRRTAAYLLREFGGAEGLKELAPLLTDSEPLVQREAVQALVLSGSDEASRILLRAIGSAAGRSRETLLGELTGLRDERAAPLFCSLVRHLDRRREPQLYVAAIDALGAFGGPDAVDALRGVLYEGDWRAPLVTRRLRAAAARALRRIGTPAAMEVLKAATAGGPRGARAAARAQLDPTG